MTRVAFKLVFAAYAGSMKTVKSVLRAARNVFCFLFTVSASVPEDFDYAQARARLPLPPSWLRR